MEAYITAITTRVGLKHSVVYSVTEVLQDNAAVYSCMLSHCRSYEYSPTIQKFVFRVWYYSFVRRRLLRSALSPNNILQPISSVLTRPHSRMFAITSVSL